MKISYALTDIMYLNCDITKVSAGPCPQAPRYVQWVVAVICTERMRQPPRRSQPSVVT